MSDPCSPLDPLETDGLAEMFNLAVGRAAASLARLVRHEIQISVPKVTLKSAGEAAAMLPFAASDPLVAVHSVYSGGLAGKIALLMPAAGSLELVALALQDEVGINPAEFEQDALQEIGNIVVNACLAALADAFANEIATSIPAVARGNRHEVMQMLAPNATSQVLLLTIDFNVRDRAIDSYMAFVLNDAEIGDFRRLLRLYIDKLMAGG